MATVVNKALAGQETHTGRWGVLKFDKDGHCEVDDEVGASILEHKLKGFHVVGLPIAAEEGEIDDEELSDEELAAAEHSGGEDAPVKPHKLGKKKTRR